MIYGEFFGGALPAGVKKGRLTGLNIETCKAIGFHQKVAWHIFSIPPFYKHEG